ncbi:tyrosine-type recombinase/integrase [Luteimonas sp. SDU82]|uniref:tyrosine-type recombinase/integrase n=1 Tax=Luteimonas sp. SDU82 TaxID=3422592 RepID=UPI003EB8D400
MQSKLTDIAARSAKPKEKPYKLAAGGGLYLEVMPMGSKYWRMKYRFAGKEKRLAIGVYPEVSLKQASVARDNARALLRDGRDPSGEKRAAKVRAAQAAENSLEAVAREWLEVRRPNWTAGQFLKEVARLENHAFPWIGRTPVGEVAVADVKPLLARLVKASKLEQAHRLRQQLSRIFRFAIATDRAERDPAGDLRDTLPAHTKKNFASVLVPDQVGELLRAMDGYQGSFPVACALKLAPLVFVRPGELRAAEWSEFDLDAKEPLWSIPAARSKLRKALKENPRTPPHLVPLSRQAIEILRELQPLTGRRKHLFPGLRDPQRPMSENTINAALRRLGYDKDTMTGHGFRHMASTLLNEMGFHRDAIERQLAHKEPGVRGVYNKAEHLPERRNMMQAWADYLDQLRTGDKKVVPLKGRAA